MESVISLIIISAFFYIVFGYASYIQDINRKKLYMLYKDKKEGFIVGGEKQTEKNTQSNIKCSDNPCKNNGKCIEATVDYDKTTMNYKCECKKQYSGYNCEFKNDSAKGVRVNLLEKDMNQPTIPVIKKIYMFDKGDNTWNNYL